MLNLNDLRADEQVSVSFWRRERFERSGVVSLSVGLHEAQSNKAIRHVDYSRLQAGRSDSEHVDQASLIQSGVEEVGSIDFGEILADLEAFWTELLVQYLGPSLVGNKFS